DALMRLLVPRLKDDVRITQTITANMEKKHGSEYAALMKTILELGPPLGRR
ncbi:2568_t:CDS:1, partial [Paraglomus occultum]